MHKKYAFTNILGTFAFNEHCKLIKSSDKKGSVEPDGKELAKILESFKRKEYFSEFRAKNIELTKELLRKSVNEDNFVMQVISNIEELDKAINMLVKRLREWYSLYNPELDHCIYDNLEFAELALKNEKRKGSMGASISKNDLEPTMLLAKQVMDIYRFRGAQEKYLEKVMKGYCPNIQAVAGTNIAARMLARAGSLKKLMEFPASTIQILGAEKAFFRHLKTHARSPKYGYLIQHPLVDGVRKDMQGKAARIVASKISIAAKVDYFKGKFIGGKLRKELENKLK